MSVAINTEDIIEALKALGYIEDSHSTALILEQLDGVFIK
jgi:hypothetical protein